MDPLIKEPLPHNHFNPVAPARTGGCYTCRWSGPQPIQFGPLMHEWRPCSRPHTWPATFPHEGCSGWQREPGSDDEVHAKRL